MEIVEVNNRISILLYNKRQASQGYYPAATYRAITMLAMLCKKITERVGVFSALLKWRRKGRPGILVLPIVNLPVHVLVCRQSFDGKPERRNPPQQIKVGRKDDTARDDEDARCCVRNYRTENDRGTEIECRVADHGLGV